MHGNPQSTHKSPSLFLKTHKLHDRSPSQNDEGQAGEPGGREEHLHLKPRVDARHVDQGEGEDRLEDEGKIQNPADNQSFVRDIPLYSFCIFYPGKWGTE